MDFSHLWGVHPQGRENIGKVDFAEHGTFKAAVHAVTGPLHTLAHHTVQFKPLLSSDEGARGANLSSHGMKKAENMSLLFELLSLSSN